MKRRHLRFGRGFRVVLENARAQAATMTAQVLAESMANAMRSRWAAFCSSSARIVTRSNARDERRFGLLISTCHRRIRKTVRNYLLQNRK